MLHIIRVPLQREGLEAGMGVEGLEDLVSFSVHGPGRTPNPTSLFRGHGPVGPLDLLSLHHSKASLLTSPLAFRTIIHFVTFSTTLPY